MGTNEEAVEKIKKSSATKSEFISRVKKYLLQQADLGAIKGIVDILFSQNFNLKEFDLTDENSATSLVAQIFNNTEAPKNLGTDVWYYFHVHPYLMQDPDPSMPEPLIGDKIPDFT